MNALQIKQTLFKNVLVKKKFRGVYASDLLLTEAPIIVGDINCYICNTAPYFHPGEHWIAIYIDAQGYGEFFDSYGLPPADVFRLFMKKNCIEWCFNTTHLQNVTSSACGHYCIYFIMERCHGKHFKNIIEMLRLKGCSSDSFVIHYVNNRNPNLKQLKNIVIGNEYEECMSSQLAMSMFQNIYM